MHPAFEGSKGLSASHLTEIPCVILGRSAIVGLRQSHFWKVDAIDCFFLDVRITHMDSYLCDLAGERHRILRHKQARKVVSIR